MATKEEIHSLLAKKQAGVSRMHDRQRRVHLRMAQLVEDRPEVIDSAVKKVMQRLENSGEATREIYIEWYEILTTWSAERIVMMLRDDSINTEQLRACAPFDFVNA
ncbi:MAG: hypothetical protein ACI9SQ_001251 [Rubritalea sp.]|jgi:hypothetical protein|tara:strand:+ start:5938 stop:6255 length:318 start_codon:yes stop_codon:yes gene_type:complete